MAASSLRNASSAARTKRFRIEAGLALQAAQHHALLRLLLDQERGAAARTRRVARPVPHRERAFRVARAAVERLAAPGAALGDLPGAALRALEPQRERFRELAFRAPRAGDEAPERPIPRDQRRPAQLARARDRRRQLGVVDRARVLAFRVARAGQERAAPAELLHQLAAAVRALDVGGLLDLLAMLLACLLRLRQVLAERSPEVVDHAVPLLLAFLDLVQLLLHAGGELDVEHVGERLDQ